MPCAAALLIEVLCTCAWVWLLVALAVAALACVPATVLRLAMAAAAVMLPEPLAWAVTVDRVLAAGAEPVAALAVFCS